MQPTSPIYKQPPPSPKPQDELKPASKKDGAKKPEKVKKSLDLKKRLRKPISLISQFKTALILVAIIILLGITILRMFSYASPPIDEAKVQENLSKFKKIHIDTEAIEKIKQLSASQVSTGTSVEQNRSNPFQE